MVDSSSVANNSVFSTPVCKKAANRRNIYLNVLAYRETTTSRAVFIFLRAYLSARAKYREWRVPRGEWRKCDP